MAGFPVQTNDIILSETDEATKVPVPLFEEDEVPNSDMQMEDLIENQEPLAEHGVDETVEEELVPPVVLTVSDDIKSETANVEDVEINQEVVDVKLKGVASSTMEVGESSASAPALGWWKTSNFEVGSSSNSQLHLPVHHHLSDSSELSSPMSSPEPPDAQQFVLLGCQGCYRYILLPRHTDHCPCCASREILFINDLPAPHNSG